MHLIGDQQDNKGRQGSKQQRVITDKGQDLIHGQGKTADSLYDYRMIRVLLLTLCGLLVLPAMAQDAKKIADAERQLASVQARIEAVDKEIKADRRRQDTLQHEMQQVEQEIAAAERQLKVLDGKQRRQTEAVREAQAAQQAAADRVRQQQAALATTLRMAHRMGDTPQTRLLLNQEDAQQMARVMQFFQYFNQARARQIDALRSELDTLKARETALATARDQLEKARAEQAETVAGLDRRRAERQAAMQSLDARIHDQGAMLKQLQRDEAGVQKLLDSLTNILADIPLNPGKAKPFAQSRGSLLPPVQGRVLAAYGQAKSGTNLRWKGQWLAAATGTPVRAAAGGRVAYVGWMHRYGLMVILEHDGGYYTLYGHADAADVRLGQWVDAGTRIARAGTSGGHRDSGIYFEIRKGRNAIDPRPWLRR